MCRGDPEIINLLENSMKNVEKSINSMFFSKFSFFSKKDIGKDANISVKDPNILPMISGELYKIRNLLISGGNSRFFTIDPTDGTFSRYKKRDDYPFTPKFLNFFNFFLYNFLFYDEIHSKLEKL